ncbi:Latent-transforming growth factor beta-binding protein like [Actinidia chinensis var. chinensis]|uniref:Latent-transforming growth factor beta-binding protein like n=1 Tax=Actinidia chinensis var. chinensis TaxID=1590841 RepID=A0A2R6QKS0_ACTCC|nr:Latent-transforming growth factor beta-binding protein like [Actinidia chinensis var. chinensis]
MALAYNISPQTLLSIPSNLMKVKFSSNPNYQGKPHTVQILAEKRCLRCKTLYKDRDNSPTACSFHGHTNGENGLFALAPPHQGIDGEWSDQSGVIVYRWNEKNNRPNTGSANWKKRWSCCAECNESAPPCRQGWHVSYDDGFTMY